MTTISKTLADRQQLEDAIARNGFGIVCAPIPVPAGLRVNGGLFGGYTVGLTASGVPELAVIARNQRTVQLALTNCAAVVVHGRRRALAEGDQLLLPGSPPLTIRHQADLTPFPEVTARYAFPRVVELVAEL